MSGLLLLGASGLAREATSVAVMLGTHRSLHVLDDDAAVWGTLHGLVPVLGPVDLAGELIDDDLLLTFGGGRVRRRVVLRLAAAGVDAARYIALLHPRVVVPGSCTVGAGSIALDGVVLTADASVGEHVVMMPQVTLTHGCTVADFATLCAGVSLGGDVHVGEAAYIGMNASVRQGVHIGADATVGMGSVVLHDVPPGETWVGVPARPVRTRTGAVT